MKALRFDGQSPKIEDVPRQGNDGEALVKVILSGICNTDLEIIRGYADFRGTIGHEFVGVVEDPGDSGIPSGKRVVGEINVGCGECKMCNAGDPRHCPGRTVLGIHGRDGCHAEYVYLPGSNLLRVPDFVPDQAAVFTEPLAAAYGITEQVAIEPGMEVAVIGDGKLGILCAWSLAERAQHLYLVGKHQSKLNVAGTPKVEGVLLKDTESLRGRFDVVVEASGSESGIETALSLLKPRGRLVLKSTIHGKVSWEPWKVVVDEITLVGSRCGRFGPALELLSAETFDLGKLISEELPLNDGIEALGRAAEPGVLKVLLRP